MSARPSRLLPVLLAVGFVLAAAGAAAAQAQITADDLNQLAWRWVGPVDFSGRIAEFAVPPGQTTTYYVLTASGGLWKTEDAGTHFEPIFEKYGNMSMGFLGIAPSNPSILYLGTGEPMHARSSSHGNGVWKSTDAGKTWTHVGLEKSFFINKVQVDPKNPDVVYVAAEGKLYDNAMDCERGFYKTTDGGKTWLNLGPMNDRGVGDFAVDPRDFNVVIAQAYKTYRRTWTYIDRQPGNNLYKTTDGGKTWKMLAGGLPVDIAAGRAGLAIYAKNPDVVYARIDEEVNLGLAERENVANFRGGFGGFGGGIFADDMTFDSFKIFKIDPRILKQAPKFTPITATDEADLVKNLNDLIADKDFLSKSGVDLPKFMAEARKVYAGKKEIIEGTDEIEKLLKREAPKPDSSEAKGRSQVVNRYVLEVLYAGILRNQEPLKRSGVIYRSEDMGETWTKITEYKLTGGSALVNQTEAGYYGRLYVDAQNDQVLYACDTNVTKSTDGGKTFKPTGWDSGAYKLHVDHRALWLDPQNSDHILDGDDGGCGETWDGGKHWSQKSTISAQQFYDVSADNEMPYNIMGGTQDNGAWLGPSQTRNAWGVFAADWRYLPTGDAFYVVRDWWDPALVYYESQFGSSSRQDLSNGQTSRLAPRTTPEQSAKGIAAQRYQWNAPIVLSPHNPGIVYVCSQYVHRSLSRGEEGSFVIISPDLSRNDKARLEESKKTNLQYATIYTFAESPKKPGLLWAGTDDGNVQMSPDGGVTWTNITAQFYDMKTGKAKRGVKGDLIPFDRWVKRVVPSRFDENTCYVGFSGYRTNNEDKTWLFVTHDMGKTFEDISGGLQNPLFDVEEDPDNANVLYISGDYGIDVSIDKGKTWTPFSTSAPNVIVRDMAIQERDRELVIGTYGRGIYVADIAPLKEMSQDVLAKDAYLFEPREVIRWNRYIQGGERYGEFAKCDNPPIGATLYYYLKAAPKSVKLVVKDLEGTVVQELAGAARKGLQKATWDLTKRAEPGQQRGAGGPGGFRRGRMNMVDNGVYKVTLNVDGKDVETKTVKISPDPMFK
jgi:photosystem II stability/assembly factor-like uncharacterized protein